MQASLDARPDGEPSDVPSELPVLVGAYAALSLLAAVASIPLGLALFVVVYGASGGDAQDRVLAPWYCLALVPIATLVFVAAATSVPARLATRISSADALRYE